MTDPTETERVEALLDEYHETARQIGIVGHGGGREALNERSAELRDYIEDIIAELRAEVEGAEMCDVCCGKPLASGKRCICNGTGNVHVAMTTLRGMLYDAEAELERRDAALRVMQPIRREILAQVFGDPGSSTLAQVALTRQQIEDLRALATGGDDARACRDCDGPMMHVGPDYWTCVNAECPSRSKTRGATTEPEEGG